MTVDGLEISRHMAPEISIGTRRDTVEMHIGAGADTVRVVMNHQIAAQVAGGLLDAVDAVRPEPWLTDGI